MPKLPNPPAVSVLAAIPPSIKTVAAGTTIWRVHSRGGRFPSAWNTFRAFGPTGSRFDHHLPPARHQQRGILYGALLGPTCLAEFFQDARTIDRVLDDPWLARFTLTRDVHLLDLTGAWPTRAGASMAINTGPRSKSRLWSQAIYSAYPRVAGIWYGSSMDANRPAVALYERARSALPAVPAFHRALADPAVAMVVKNAARRFGYAVL